MLRFTAGSLGWGYILSPGNRQAGNVQDYPQGGEETPYPVFVGTSSVDVSILPPWFMNGETNMEATTKTVTDNRDAKKSDAQTLANAYGSLVRAEKSLKTAVREVKNAWLSDSLEGEMEVARTRRTRTQTALDTALDAAWAVLIGLPNGTTAPGGATPQTVALHFFNSGLNRNLKARLSSTEAKRLNKLSFGG